MRFECTCCAENSADDCATLAPRALAGDEAARRELHDRFRDLVEAIVRERLGASRTAEWDDACQEIFLRLFVNLDMWRGTGKFCAWLKVLAARQAITTSIRLSSRRREVELDEVDPQERPQLDVATRECLDCIAATFPEPWKKALRLRSQGATVKTIAEEMQVSDRTIKKWIAVMYDRLSDCLSDSSNA